MRAVLAPVNLDLQAQTNVPSSRMAATTTHLGVRVSFQLRADLERIAKDEHRTLSNVASMMLAKAIAEREAAKQQETA